MKFYVDKSTVIDAPMDKVRPLIENFHNWNSWSPWTIIEPDCPIEIQGEPANVGHTMSWDGKIIGSGKNTIESIDKRRISYNLEFLKPWKSKSKTRFIFEEPEGQTGEKTKVTWKMESSMPFFLFFMVPIMRNWVGMDYERGLRMLKEIAEKGQVDCKTTNNGINDYKGFSYVGIKRTTSFEDMPTQMKKDFEKLEKDIVQGKQKNPKHWVSVYPKFNMRKMEMTYIAAVSDEDLKSENLGSEYVSGEIKDGKTLEINHEGSYEFLGNAWSMGMMNMTARKLKGKGYPFEYYWNNPNETAPNDLKTGVYFPVKG